MLLKRSNISRLFAKPNDCFERLLKYLDIILLLYGHHVKAGPISMKRKVISILIKIGIISMVLNKMYRDGRKLFQTSKNDDILLNVQRVLYYLCVLATHLHYTCFAVPALRKILKNSSTVLGSKQKQSLFRLILVSLVLWTIFNIGDTVTTIASWYIGDGYSNMDLMLILDLYGNFTCGAWIFLTIVIYNWLIICHYLAQATFFNIMWSLDSISMPEARLYWHNINEIKNSIENSFSLYPVVWFLNVFAKSFAYVVVTKVRSDSSDTKVRKSYLVYIFWYYLISEAVFAMSTIFIIDYCKTKSFEMLERVKGRFQRNAAKISIDLALKKIQSPTNSNKSSSDINWLFNEVNADLRCNYTGWGMFSMEKSFILGLLSALVTFSALALQFFQ